MVGSSLAAWMDLYAIYIERMESSFRRARECVRLARVIRVSPGDDSRAFKEFCRVARVLRSAAARWRERAWHLAVGVLSVASVACTGHDNNETGFLAVSDDGVVAWTYTIPDATLETLYGDRLDGRDTINLNPSSGTQLTGAIDAHLSHLHLCPGAWEFDRAYRKAGEWYFEGHCSMRAIKG